MFQPNSFQILVGFFELPHFKMNCALKVNVRISREKEVIEWAEIGPF